MRYVFAALFVALIAPPVSAAKLDKGDQTRKVACNKGWHVYMKQHNLKGYDRKKYIAACMDGRIEPPAVTSDDDDD